MQGSESYRSAETGSSIGTQGWGRVHAFDIQQIEHLLEPVFSPNTIHGVDEKWSLGGSVIFILASSACLWAAIVLGIEQLF